MAERTAVSEREQVALDLIERRARQAGEVPRRRSITMAHGAGGKATQTLIEGLLAPGLRRAGSGALGDAALVEGGGARADDRQLRRQADPLPRRLDRRARGERHGQRPRRRRGAPARAHALARARGGARRGRPAGRGRGDRRRRRGGRGVEVVAGDTKVVERGHCDSMYVTTTGLGQLDPRARALARTRSGPGDRILVSGPIGEHGTAVMLARGEFELEAPVESDTRSLWPAGRRAARRRRPVAALPARRDPGRRRLGAERARAASGVAMVVREAAVPVRPAGAPARARSSASTPCTSRTRACSSPSSRPRRPTPRSRRCASAPGCEARRRSAR